MKTLYRYITGYALSLILTGVAFWLVLWHVSSDHEFPPHEVVLPILVVLAIIQLFVQLTLFLHVGDEKKPRWNLLALVFALIVVTILVGGTLWIMHNLEYGHTTSTETYIGNDITPQNEND